MKKLFFALLPIFIISISYIISCSSPQAKDISGASVPYLFQEVINLGSVGNPDVEIALDTDFPDVPDNVTIYNVDKSTINNDYAADISRQLGFSGEPAYLEPGSEREVYSYSDGSKILEVFTDGRLRIYTNSDVGNIPASLPSEEECTTIAREWLTSHKLYPEITTTVEISKNKTVNSVDTDSGVISEPTPLSLKINFFTSINGFELYSPVASVVIGEGGKILEVSVNSLPIKEYGIVSLKTPDDSLSILRGYLSSTKVVPDEAKECITNWRGFARLVIDRISLQYTFSENSFVQPVYVFEGVIFGESFPAEGEEFIGRIDAIAR